MNIKETELFDKSTLPRLVDSLNHQIADNTYDAHVVHAIIKMFQFFPDTAEEDVIRRCFAKSLMALPEPDFLTCLYMVPDETHLADTISALIDMERHLQTCDFAEFWKSAATEAGKAATDDIPGFFAAIRKFILTTIQMTYTIVDRKVVQRALNADDISEFVAGWPSVDGEYLQVPKPDGVVQRKQKFSAGISLPDVAGIVKQLAT